MREKRLGHLSLTCSALLGWEGGAEGVRPRRTALGAGYQPRLNWRGG